MNSSTLKNLLIEYERKKSNAEYEADLKKQELLKKTPSLQEIENKLSRSCYLYYKNSYSK